MDAVEKVKIALDETRMLVLGADVLLGFQLQCFQGGFDALADHAKARNGVALLLMVAVVGFLVAPANPRSSRRYTATPLNALCVISVAMTAALGLFAISLGINIFTILERMTDPQWAAAGGITMLALASFWFGATGLAMMRKVLMMADHRPH